MIYINTYVYIIIQIDLHIYFCTYSNVHSNRYFYIEKEWKKTSRLSKDIIATYETMETTGGCNIETPYKINITKKDQWQNKFTLQTKIIE